MNLTVETREKVGTASARDTRAKGHIPAEVYGHGFANAHVAVPVKEFNKAFKEAGETTVITLHMGTEKIPALIYDVTHDPRSGAVRHIDFYRVRMDEKITAKVPVEFVGESPAVKEGGVLVKAVHEIEVEALPGDMPRHFEVDLVGIAEIGGSVYVKDIKDKKALESGIIKVAPDMVLATVIAQRAEEEEVAPVASIEDIAVESEEKKAEREKEKAAGAEEEK